MDAEPDLPDICEDDPRWVRCAIYTRQSVKRPGDDPAVMSCAIQRMLCTEFIRSKTWQYWYPIAERFDDEGESGDGQLNVLCNKQTRGSVRPASVPGEVCSSA